MNNSHHSTESPKKTIEPLITIPKSPIVYAQSTTPESVDEPSTYNDLIYMIKSLEKYIRPCYIGHRSSSDKFKQGIMKARLLVKECILECEQRALE